MARLHFLYGPLILSLLAVVSAAQSQSPSAPVSSKPAPSSPAPSMHALIDSLQPAELQQVIPLLKNNFVNPGALNEIELNRATLEGLMIRLGHGVVLLPDRAAAATESASPFYSEVLGGHIGYLRLGSLTVSNLQAMDGSLKNFAGQKVDALVLDFRATPQTNDFATAAEFAKRFAPKGKTLFILRKPAARQDRTFSSERDPTYQGMLAVLIDNDTAGAAEAVAGLLRLYSRAMIIGQASAGRAVEYSDLPLPSGKILRVAVSEVMLPEMRSLFPEGLTPDLPVEMARAEKREVFQQSMTKGMSRFVFESERPHLNEAALLAGTNPELEAIQAAQRAGRSVMKEALHDPVVQRAVDLVTSVAIYQKR
jgi:C-terminal processing protease CtpA/Prc